MLSPGVIREFYPSKTSAVFYILRKTFSTSTRAANKELSFGQTKKSLCVIINQCRPRLRLQSADELESDDQNTLIQRAYKRYVDA